MDTMEMTTIAVNISNRDFFVVDDGSFILVTEPGQKNMTCFFDDKLTEKARAYADKNVPDICIVTDNKKDFIGKQQKDYWQILFNLYIWEWLQIDNKVSYVKKPKYYRFQ